MFHEKIEENYLSRKISLKTISLTHIHLTFNELRNIAGHPAALLKKGISICQKFSVKLKFVLLFRFADCFVCGQAGHLAKACPDNPRGLYPKGGGCRFCGSVEHLKSDCPRKVQKDAKNQVRLQRQVDQGIEEVVDNSVIKHRKVMKQQKMSKVVNF